MSRKVSKLYLLAIVTCFLGVTTASLAQENFPPLPTQKPVSFFDKVKNTFFEHSDIEQTRDYASCKQSKKLSSLNTEKSLNNTASIYKQIFDLQSKGDFKDADKLIKSLDDCRLMGHVAVQRFLHPTHYTAKFNELAEWLDAYSDHPAASRVYKLAQIRRAKSQRKKLKSPNYKNALRGTLEPSLMSGTKIPPKPVSRSDEKARQVSSLLKKIHSYISDGKPSVALKTFNEAKISKSMTNLEKAFVKTTVAQSYMIEGRYKLAFSLAAPVADKYGSDIPVSRWVAGLISWMREDYRLSGNYFSQIADAENGNGWFMSAANFWAARAYLRRGSTDLYDKYMRRAAEHPRTFYGFLAAKALGQNLSFNWQNIEFTDEHRQNLLRDSAGARAILLVQAEKYTLAEQELSGLRDFNHKETRDAVLAFALHKRLPALAMRYGNSFKDENGRFYDKALYPTMPWIGLNEYSANPAVVHAIVRQESKFAPRAVSYGNAVGLMQILPSTAAYVSDNEAYKTTEKHKLKDPVENLEVGQNYIQSLLNLDRVNGELFGLLISYNAGPGNYSRWKSKLSSVKDPLLFIELVPSAETRAYVERVMRNLWVYEISLGQESDSVKTLLAGKWPKYEPQN